MKKSSTCNIQTLQVRQAYMLSNLKMIGSFVSITGSFHQEVERAKEIFAVLTIPSQPFALYGDQRKFFFEETLSN